MGLRFRKSVKICKGVKLNFSNSGTSVTFGEKGYHKTISSTGRVTTTVGLPGTGIYWTDSKKIGGAKKKTNSKAVNNRSVQTYSPYVDEIVPSTIEHDSIKYDDPIQIEPIDPIVSQIKPEKKVHLEDFFSGIEMPTASMEQNMQIEKIVSGDSSNQKTVDYNQIRNIYVRCDEAIEWDEIQAGVSFSELMMDRELWTRCRKYASRIVNGEVDAYLEVIEEFKPVDDLLLYCGDFEYGTDKGNYIEVEFDIIPNSVLQNKDSDPLFKEYVYSVSIRVARDIMALLPVSNALVHVVYDDKTILSVLFKKSLMVSIDYKKLTASEIVNKFKKNDGMKNTPIVDVERIVI